MPHFRRLSALLCVLLVNCGGGGGASAAGGSTGGTPTPTPTPLPSVDVSAVAPGNVDSALPANWQKGAFMEIFVRGYKDSNGDGIGDLKGITQSLDYLKDLGIKGIWLMPITASQDHDHGYAVTDYRNVEADYGNLADLDALIAQAHARGIGVILDYVPNHCGSLNPIFVNSNASAANTYRNWYVWQNPAPTGWNIYGNNPWYAGTDGYYLAQFSYTMPDFNYLNASVLSYHQDNLRFWLNRGVDGFRFDAVTHLVENGANAWDDQSESYPLMGKLRGAVNAYAQRFMVCEATANPRRWADNAVCGSAFAFDHQQDIVNAARGQSAAIAAVANYFNTAPLNMSTMISNHDLFAGERLWDQVGGNLAQYKLAAATYLLQPGTPFIYYGEEIGMSAGLGLSGDGKLRTPMSWSADTRTAGFSTATPFRPVSANVATQNVAAQLTDPNSLLAFYKTMLALRNSYPSIARGSYDAAIVSGSTMVYQRTLGPEKTVVAINYGSTAARVTVTGLSAAVGLTAAYPSNAPSARADGAGAVELSVGAQSVNVWVVGP